MARGIISIDTKSDKKVTNCNSLKINYLYYGLMNKTNR